MIPSFVLGLALTSSAANGDASEPRAEHPEALFDLVPDQLPPSRTHCTLSSSGDYHEFTWDPVTGADAARRLLLREGTDYHLSCMGEMLPSLDEPVGGLVYPRRWAFSTTLSAHDEAVGTMKNAYVRCETVVGDGLTTAAVKCTPGSYPIRLLKVTRPSEPQVELKGLLDPERSVSGLDGASAPRLLGSDPTVALDRLFALAADVIVTEVRQAGMEGLKRELMQSLRCDRQGAEANTDPSEASQDKNREKKDRAAPLTALDLDHTCQALDALTLEHLVENRELLARAAMLDIAELTPLSLDQASEQKLVKVLIGAVAAIVLLESGSELELGGLTTALDAAAEENPDLRAAMMVLSDCKGATCPTDTLTRLIEQHGGQNADRVAALVVALDAVLRPGKDRTRVERVGDAIRLARLALPKNDDRKRFHGALDTLEALSQGHLGEAARRALALVPQQAVPFVQMAAAVGAVAVEVRAAGELDQAEWEIRSEQYKEAILVWLRSQRSRETRDREFGVGLGSTLAFEAGSFASDNDDGQRTRALRGGVAVPLEVGADLFMPVDCPVNSVRVAMGVADLSAYAEPLLVEIADDKAEGSEDALSERLKSAQRYSVSIGATLRTGRVPFSVSTTYAWRPATSDNFIGIRTGFFVPFLDRRVARY